MHKDHQNKIKEKLFSRDNIIVEKEFKNVDSVRVLIRNGSEENLYHLYLEVQENESERALNLLSNSLHEHNGVQIHIAPCIKQ